MQSFTIEEFKKIHQAWKKSGLSVRDYCANTGIKESRFYYWKKRIEDGDSLPTPTGGFIPVKLNGKSCKLDSHITSGTCASDVLCELVYQNGVTLRVTSDMTLDQLCAMVLLLNWPMFTLSDSDKFYLYPFPTGMRKSFYSLSGIVLNEMHQDIQQGDAFFFVNCSLTSMKILHMEFVGLVFYNLKLEQGRIQLPEMDQDDSAVSRNTKWSELVMMTHGLSKTDVRQHPRWIPHKKDEKKS